ncbi:hypothetical protein [Aggregatibacter actinomycetemcomitans]|uniref:hypothetical protein n=1 Tax=Aggregatibacter actinomycetemcomitans TaxID=714 RepID=UPI001C556916|nr:hypothetical protein [Aggregatibacter actinomycetemcomitans]
MASLQVIAGMYAPKGGLERHTSQALSELEQLTARKSLQQSKWISYFVRYPMRRPQLNIFRRMGFGAIVLITGESLTKKKLMSGQEKDRHHLKQEYLKPVNLVIPKVNLRSPMKFVTTKYFSLEYTS